MEEAESRRIHLDWWGKCRTCKWWGGRRPDRLKQLGANLIHADCSNQITFPGGTGLTTANGYCPEWDSFDVDVALEVMEGEKKP